MVTGQGTRGDHDEGEAMGLATAYAGHGAHEGIRAVEECAMEQPGAYMVVCPDGDIRHEGTFPTYQQAWDYAENGHVCLAASKHTITRRSDEGPLGGYNVVMRPPT